MSTLYKGKKTGFKDVRALKFPRPDFFQHAMQKSNGLLLPKRQKKMGVTNFVLERTCTEKHPKSEKSGHVS